MANAEYTADSRLMQILMEAPKRPSMADFKRKVDENSTAANDAQVRCASVPLYPSPHWNASRAIDAACECAARRARELPTAASSPRDLAQ